MLKSAHKSAAAFANQDALNYFDRALHVHKQIKDAPREILLKIYSGRAEVNETMNQFAQAVDNYNLVRDLAHTIGNRTLEGQAIAGAATCYVYMHNWTKAESMAKEVLVIANEDQDDTVKTGGIFTLCFLESIRGNLISGLKGAKEVVRLSLETNQPSYEVFGYAYQNFIHSWCGHFEKAHSIGQKGIKTAERYQKASPLVQIQWTDALSLAGLGRYSEALVSMKNSVNLCERLGAANTLSRIWNTLGWVYNELSDWDRANECDQIGLEIALNLRDSEIIFNAKINQADTEVGIGNNDKARKMLEELYTSLPQQHEWMKWRYTQHLTHSLGEVLLAEGDLDRALSLADECLALAEPTESRKNIIKGRRLRGQVFYKQGEFMEAEKEFSKALAIAQEIGNPPQLWKTYIALGDLQHDLKKKDKALQAYHNAVLVIENVAKGLNDKSLKETFLNSEHVKSIVKKAKQ